MVSKNLFNKTGVHCIVDGSFGSTGKGALASWLAFQAEEMEVYVDGCIYSGGPNSGHTFYFGNQKQVLKQVPTTSVALTLMTGTPQIVYISAGGIIDIPTLFEEARRYPLLRIYVHPNAAVVSFLDKVAETEGTIAEVAGTRSGAGAALARKVYRDPRAIWSGVFGELENIPSNIKTQRHNLRPETNFYFMEVSQGFSLGINSHFYPKVTSRECTVMQGLADARVPPRLLSKTYMAIRTYPIRVGNVDGHSSGDWYQDQEEITWEALGVTPELTTVTQRVRRVATFSQIQFEDAMHANDPDWVFVNFLNYLNEGGQEALLEEIGEYCDRSYKPVGLLGGYGPTVNDIRLLRDEADDSSVSDPL